MPKHRGMKPPMSVVLDLCSSNPCQQESLCQSTEGGFLCACPEGYEGKDCMSLKDPCHGAHCQGSRGTLYLIIILLSVLAVLVISLCVFLIVRHRRRKDCQRSPPDESINNQREYINLIRNLPKPEEIELALPPPTSAPLPEKKLLMQCPEVPKVDISNLEREKLNHFHCPDWEELEV
ncbi:delta-like protein A [Acipenser ruthenus]|uniref:delta-like protein A n=1 Tax=Acipenser ruthenus TaxID=7906 RepID=UPI002740D624|nr:delta-like protein A [Acipenser ruthenus]